MIRKDHFLSGFIPGVLSPLLGFYLYYLFFFRYMSFGNFISHLLRSQLFISVLSIGVILNLLVFFLFYRIEADRSVRGVVAATFLYAFLVVYFRVIR